MFRLWPPWPPTVQEALRLDVFAREIALKVGVFGCLVALVDPGSAVVYRLVNIQKTMEHHNFQWENSL